VPVSATEGSAFTGTVATFTDTAGTDVGATFGATINWGDGTSSPGTIMMSVGGTPTFSVTGTHTYAEESPPTGYTVTVTITHETAPTVTVSTVATVTDPPVMPTAVPVTATEGTPTGLIPVATFTDPGTPAGAARGSYSATIDWGDGTAPTAGNITLAAGVFTVSGNHTYAEESAASHPGSTPYMVKVTILHEATTATVTTTATVAEAALVGTQATVAATEGAPTGTITVATFVDLGGPEAVGDYIASIDWGDGTALTTGTVALGGNNVFSVTGSHIYTEEATYKINVTITHEAATPITVTDTVAVFDPAVVATGVAVTATEGAPTGLIPVATFTDPGTAAGESLGAYSATIDWGDGTPVGTGVITNSSGTFTVSGRHIYAEEGTFTVKVTILHENAPPATATSTATVADIAVSGTAVPVSATEGSAFTGTVATFTDPGTPLGEPLGDYSATISWGDGSPNTAGLIALGPVVNGVQTFTVTGTHTYAEEIANGYTITVTINHDQLTTPTTVTTTATVADPAVVPAGQTFNATEGSAFNGVVATFVDPAGGEPNASDMGALATHYNAMINWGDGTTTPGTIALNPAIPGGNGYTVSGMHTYTEESATGYTVTVTINHESAPAATATSTAIVADAPVVVTSNPLSIPEASQFSGTVATFTDPAGAEAISNYSAVIDWGDGTTPTAGTIAAGPGGTFLVNGEHVYIAEGGFTVKTTVSHESAPNANSTATANVSDLLIFQATNPVLPVAGGTVVYTITVTNPTANPATNALITDMIPQGTTLISFAASQGTIANVMGSSGQTPNGVAAALGTIPAGASPTITIQVRVNPNLPQGVLLTNTATTVTPGDPANDNDDPPNVAIAGTVAALTVTTSASNAHPASGSTLTYTVTVRDTGPSDAQNVTVTDTLPAGLQVLSASATQGTTVISGTTVSANLGTLPFNSSALVVIVAQVPPGTPTGTTYNDSATVTSTTGTNLATTGQSVTSAVVTVTARAPTTVGVFDAAAQFGNPPATWKLKNTNQVGSPDFSTSTNLENGFQYGSSTSTGVMGDWNGDGVSTVGVVDVVNGLLQWSLRNHNSPGAPDIAPFFYGTAGEIPIVGDWTGQGKDTVGIFDPTTATFALRNSNTAGAPNFVFTYGLPGDIPAVGDWIGQGKTTIGVVRPQQDGNFLWLLRNSNSAGAVDITPFEFGAIGTNPVTGDWIGQGKTTVGVFDPTFAVWSLRNSNSAGAPDITPFPYGSPMKLSQPVPGQFGLPALEQVAGGSRPFDPNLPSLSQDDLQFTVTAAINRLALAGVSQNLLDRLGQTQFSIADLPDGILGETFTTANRVLVSAKASGHGWFVDPTPGQDEEFTSNPDGTFTANPGSNGDGRIDLLTLVLHEMGHIDNLPNISAVTNPGDLMNGYLADGQRLTSALDRVFARGDF
jgi:uncharacterized repeat protein (TIGR01451 family)